MKILAVTTDKNGFKRKIGAFVVDEEVRGAQSVEIGREPSVDSFLGFGVALTGSSCYLLNRAEKSARDRVLGDTFGKDGLNLSVARVSVGSSDYSAELYCYEDKYGNFSIDKDREYVLPTLKEALKANRDLKFFSAPWSPPGRMKTGGSMCGGFMREKYLEEFAEYYCKFLAAYKNEGIDIFALTAQNEPETDQLGKMPACLLSPELEAKFVLILREKMRQYGLGAEIWLCDHSFSYVDRVLWQLKEFPELKNAVSGAAFHYYGGGADLTDVLRAKYPGFAWHFTEGGPRLYENYDTDWCKWGVTICHALNHGTKSFTGWNLLLDETGAPNIGPFFCGGLITLNSQSGELSYSGQYRALAHFAPVIDRGNSIYPCKVHDVGAIETSRYPALELPCAATVSVNQKSGAVALFYVNPTKVKKQVTFDLRGNTVYFEALPDSLTTVRIEE